MIWRLLGLDLPELRKHLKAMETRVSALEKHTGINGATEATDDLGRNGR